jgi:Fungal protein kinase
VQGTWPYKSRNVLEGGPHTYIDDLESFFYVICFIVAEYKRPFTPVRPRSGLMEAWESKFSMQVKHGWITCRSFNVGVSDWFGEPFRKLGASLHSFFERRSWNAREARENGRTPPPQIPSVDYEEFISYIVEAISAIESSVTPLPSPEPSPVRSEGVRESSQNNSDTSGDPHRPRFSSRRRIPPVSRPRRSTANYE